MKDLLEKLDARKKELASLSPMNTADAERLWKKFRLEWNYNSNHIEGNTLTYQETELVLIFDQAPGGHTVREIEEMKAHDVAVALVRAWADDHSRELSEADIRSLNETLLVRPFWKEAITPDGQSVRRLIKVGEYKEFPNSVRLQNGEMFNYAEPHEVEAKMGDLISWYRKDSKEVDPAIVAAKLHYDFVRVHPFDDGNGRVSRLLMNYYLLRHGFPPVIIKSEDKKGYLAALNRADVGDFEVFVRYIGEQMIWSLDLSIRAAKGESVEEEGDWGKQVELLKREAVGINSNFISKKINQEAAITNWLEKIFSSIKKEMEDKIGVFEKFFEKTTFQAIVIDNYSNRHIDILSEKLDLAEFTKGAFNNGSNANIRKYNPTITFIYNFEGFKFGTTEEFIGTTTLPVTIAIYEDKIKIFRNEFLGSEISIWTERKVTASDLLPVRELAETLFMRIQTAIGQS